MGWAGIGAWDWAGKLPRVDARKECSWCSNQEVLGECSNNTTAHHLEVQWGGRVRGGTLTHAHEKAVNSL